MNGLVVLATFTAAGVEWVEALTIVLAVAVFRSWRTALLATLAALGVLAALVVVFGVSLRSYLPENVTQGAVGIFLLLFGLGWLYKAILRSTGLKALHDEAAAFEETREELMSHGRAFGTAFAGVFLEGLEVVFIVVALAGLNSGAAAVTGAAASLVVVVGAGLVLRQPLTKVPENTLKYAVGIMLTSFGTFFAGEGLGVQWWHQDLVILPLIVVYGLGSLILVALLRREEPLPVGNPAPVRWVRSAVSEVWGLFVTNGVLAAAAVAAILFASLWQDRMGAQRSLAGPLLVAGVVFAISAALVQAYRKRPAPRPSSVVVPQASAAPAEDSVPVSASRV